MKPKLEFDQFKNWIWDLAHLKFEFEISGLPYKHRVGDSDSGIGVETGTSSKFDQFGTGVGIGINFFFLN